MPARKKRDTNRNSIENLLLNPPKPNSSRRRTQLIVLLLIGSLFAIGLISSYTGYSINRLDTNNIIQTTTDLDTPFKVIDVPKDENSVLNVQLSSTVKLNIFTETTDCSAWKSGQDTNNQVLHAISNVKDANFRVGDPSIKTRQHLEIYKSDNPCIILINKEFPNKGEVSITITQTEKDRWNIIE